MPLAIVGAQQQPETPRGEIKNQ